MIINSAAQFFIECDPMEGWELPLYLGGTGHLIKFQGAVYFLTAAHAVENKAHDGYRKIVVLDDNNGEINALRVISVLKPKSVFSESEDWIAIKLDRETANALDLGGLGYDCIAEELAVGCEICVIGFPFRSDSFPINLANQTVSKDLSLKHGTMARAEKSKGIGVVAINGSLRLNDEPKPEDPRWDGMSGGGDGYPTL